MQKIVIAKKAESIAFYSIAILFSLPFVMGKFMPTMDGASHIYNSTILNQLFFYGNDCFKLFFQVNPEPVPNWTGHLILSLLNLFLPAYLAEKVLIIILLIGLPMAFRKFTTIISPENTTYSFLIFPFTHSMFFWFGFYNFCIGIILFFITLSYWIEKFESDFTWRKIIALSILINLTYFSHIFVFGILLIVLILHIVTQQISQCFFIDPKKIFFSRLFFKKFFVSIAASIIPTVLFVYFFSQRPETASFKYLSLEEQWNLLSNITPLIAFNSITEGALLRLLFTGLLISTVIGIAYSVRYYSGSEYSASRTRPNDLILTKNIQYHLWLFSCLILLLAIFLYLPDSYGTASYTSHRIAFILFLILVLFAGTLYTPPVFRILTVALSIYVNTALTLSYIVHLKENRELAEESYNAAEFAEPNSTILPIYCADNWFTGHFVDYIAADKPLILVYNYECDQGYFPIRWNIESKPNFYIGSGNRPDDKIEFILFRDKPSIPIDYVFVLGAYDFSKNDFFKKLDLILKNKFIKVYQSEHCALFKNSMAKSVSFKDYENAIRNNTEWMSSIKKKANDRGIRPEEMIRLDALWMYSHRQ